MNTLRVPTDLVEPLFFQNRMPFHAVTLNGRKLIGTRVSWAVQRPPEAQWMRPTDADGDNLIMYCLLDLDTYERWAARAHREADGSLTLTWPKHYCE